MKNATLAAILMVVVLIAIMSIPNSRENQTEETENKEQKPSKSVYYASDVVYDNDKLTFTTIKRNGTSKHIFSAHVNNLVITEIKKARDHEKYPAIEDYTHYVTVENGPHNSLLIDIFDMQ
ncbi:MAG: hypothetical protein ABIK07_02765 [Planctomycetota bacterium]